MDDPNDDAPMVPNLNNATTHTARPDGGGETRTRRARFDRPIETTGSEDDRHREEIEPGAADLR
ncbi:MAG: hypothetical protein ABEJ05_12565 [Haloglomus sp.]